MLTILLLTALQTASPLSNVLRGIDNAISDRELAKLSSQPAIDLATIARDQNESAHVRARAAQLLSQFTDASTQLTIADLTADSLAQVRVAAGKVMARWASRPQLALAPSVIAAMDRALDDEDFAVALQAIRALGVVSSEAYPGARQRLLGVYKGSESEALRHAIATVLAVKRAR